MSAGQAEPGPRWAASATAGSWLGGDWTPCSRSCSGGAESVLGKSYVDEGLLERSDVDDLAGLSANKPFRSRKAQCASETHTKYPRWIDENRVSRAASTHPRYSTWKQARARCHNPGHERYEDYGGRGIQMYPEWREDPVAFYEYVETLTPCLPGSTLDRIRNDGHYEPGNLRWATPAEQANNRRKRGEAQMPAWASLLRYSGPCLCSYPFVCGGEHECALDRAA